MCTLCLGKQGNSLTEVRLQQLHAPRSNHSEHTLPVGTSTEAHINTTYMHVYSWPHQSGQADTQSSHTNMVSSSDLILLRFLSEQDGCLLVGNMQICARWIPPAARFRCSFYTVILLRSQFWWDSCLEFGYENGRGSDRVSLPLSFSIHAQRACTTSPNRLWHLAWVSQDTTFTFKISDFLSLLFFYYFLILFFIFLQEAEVAI